VVKLDEDTFLMVKDMEDGSKAVGLFNRGELDTPVTAKWPDLGVSGRQVVRDLWRQKDLGVFESSFQSTVGRHGVVMVRLTAAAK
jgi:alpha-galactosidase